MALHVQDNRSIPSRSLKKARLRTRPTLASQVVSVRLGTLRLCARRERPWQDMFSLLLQNTDG